MIIFEIYSILVNKKYLIFFREGRLSANTEASRAKSPEEARER